MTSCDPAPGSSTTGCLESHNLVSSLSGSARLCLDRYKQRMLRPVSEDADKEAWLGPAGRYVDPGFQQSRRHCGFRPGSGKSWFHRVCWRYAGQHVGLFLLPRRLVLRGSLLMLVQAIDI